MEARLFKSISITTLGGLSRAETLLVGPLAAGSVGGCDATGELGREL